MSPVCVMFCVVAPQCTQPPCGSPATRDISHTSGTMVCEVRASASSMFLRSSSSSFEMRAMTSAELFRNDAEIALRLRQRRLDIEPRLPAAFDLVELADAGIGQPRL